MTTVTLTQEFSGFSNVQDTWTIGEDDSSAGTIGTYELPDGFRVGDNYGNPIIIGPDGYECIIVTHKPTGRPQLLGGAKMPVLVAVGEIAGA